LKSTSNKFYKKSDGLCRTLQGYPNSGASKEFAARRAISGIMTFFTSFAYKSRLTKNLIFFVFT